MRNPLAKANLVLAVTEADWTAIKSAVQTYLTANADKAEVDEATVRALHVKLADDRVWNEVKRILGV